MAVTVAFAKDNQGLQYAGKQHQVSGRLTLTSTYATGGFAVTPSTFGLARLDSLTLGMAWLTTTALGTAWDSANSKIKLEQSTTGAPSTFLEVANATDVSNYVIDVVAKGAM